MNYSILTNELENETALEDMHMFFVAFNKRQKRICEQVEDLIKGSKNLEEIETRELNVVPLEEEVDID